MGQVEYLGKTRDGVEAIIRNDATHYRAFSRKSGEMIGTPKIKFSALAAELGLTMDGSRPETDQQTAAPAEVPVAAPVKPHFGKTRDGVAVEVNWNGTHWLAVDGAGEMVGAPMIHLQDLAMKIGLVYGGGEGEPGEKDLTRGEGEADQAVEIPGDQSALPLTGEDSGAGEADAGKENIATAGNDSSAPPQE